MCLLTSSLVPFGPTFYPSFTSFTSFTLVPPFVVGTTLLAPTLVWGLGSEGGAPPVKLPYLPRNRATLSV